MTTALQKSEFELYQGQSDSVNRRIAELARYNWRPILLSTASTPTEGVVVTVVLEHVLET